MTKKIAHIVDGLSHGLYIFGRNMNEYRHIITKNSLLPTQNNFTNGTPADDLYRMVFVKNHFRAKMNKSKKFRTVNA